jgi:pimeloyl-ACP methyl ester carboxylesterase
MYTNKGVCGSREAMMQTYMVVSQVFLSLFGAAGTASSSAPRCEAALSGNRRATEAFEWCRGGSAFTWLSAANDNRPLEIFWRCDGDPSKPAIYMNHGWPTSSYDFKEIWELLVDDFYLCAIDTPGYGFSSKPRNHSNSIFEDADIVEHFLTNVAGLTSFTLLTHDKGDSVGLEVLDRYNATMEAGADPGYLIAHHILLNGSIHLAEANISSFQNALLNPAIGPWYADLLTGRTVANLLGKQ